MCDLWRFTTRDRHAGRRHPGPSRGGTHSLAERGEQISRVKLYNASNFFDPRAVPESDYGDIAAATRRGLRAGDRRVASLAHRRPRRAVSRRARRPRLEVAMGLETVHPAALDALNKRMTTEDFARRPTISVVAGCRSASSCSLRHHSCRRGTGRRGCCSRSRLLKSCGASVISLIPTRAGNGTMEALTAQKLFRAPTQEDVDRSMRLVARTIPQPQLQPQPQVPSPQNSFGPVGACGLTPTSPSSAPVSPAR